MIHAAWGATEITRYLYYFLHLDLSEPHALTWLRYSLFIVLYPLGTTGELLVVTAARFDLAAHTYEEAAGLTPCLQRPHPRAHAVTGRPPICRVHHLPAFALLPVHVHAEAAEERAWEGEGRQQAQLNEGTCHPGCSALRPEHFTQHRSNGEADKAEGKGFDTKKHPVLKSIYFFSPRIVLVFYILCCTHVCMLERVCL